MTLSSFKFNVFGFEVELRTRLTLLGDLLKSLPSLSPETAQKFMQMMAQAQAQTAAPRTPTASSIDDTDWIARVVGSLIDEAQEMPGYRANDLYDAFAATVHDLREAWRARTAAEKDATDHGAGVPPSPDAPEVDGVGFGATPMTRE